MDEWDYILELILRGATTRTSSRTTSLPEAASPNCPRKGGRRWTDCAPKASASVERLPNREPIPNGVGSSGSRDLRAPPANPLANGKHRDLTIGSGPKPGGHAMKQPPIVAKIVRPGAAENDDMAFADDPTTPFGSFHMVNMSKDKVCEEALGRRQGWDGRVWGGRGGRWDRVSRQLVGYV